MLVYAIVIPVFPFRLQALGYQGVSGLVGWLLFAFVSISPICVLTTRSYLNLKSAGLVLCTQLQIPKY